MQKALFPGYTVGPDAYEDIVNICSAYGKKAAIIGDMAELGELTERAHKEIGELTKELGIDTVIAIGARAKYFTEGNPSAQWFGRGDGRRQGGVHGGDGDARQGLALHAL